MAWAYPRHRFTVSDILDLDDFNDNVSAFVYEASALNEANWADDALSGMLADTNNSKVDNGVAMSLFQQVVDNDPHGGSLIDIPQSAEWETISGTTKVIDTKSGMLLIIASWQFNNAPTGNSKQTGLMWAIELDTVVRYESLVGSGDLDNDITEFPSVWVDDTTTAGVVPASFFGTGPAVKSAQYGLTTSLLMPVNAGRHTVALAARNLATDTSNLNQEVSQVEIIVLELWA